MIHDEKQIIKVRKFGKIKWERIFLGVILCVYFVVLTVNMMEAVGIANLNIEKPSIYLMTKRLAIYERFHRSFFIFSLPSLFLQLQFFHFWKEYQQGLLHG